MKYLFLLTLFFVSACSGGVDGVYYKTTHENPYFGWNSLEFKSDGVLLINGGEFKSHYKVEGSKIIMQAGILETIGDIKNSEIIIRPDGINKAQEVFKKR